MIGIRRFAGRRGWIPEGIRRPVSVIRERFLREPVIDRQTCSGERVEARNVVVVVAGSLRRHIGKGRRAPIVFCARRVVGRLGSAARKRHVGAVGRHGRAERGAEEGTAERVRAILGVQIGIGGDRLPVLPERRVTEAEMVGRRDESVLDAGKELVAVAAESVVRIKGSVVRIGRNGAVVKGRNLAANGMRGTHRR